MAIFQGCTCCPHVTAGHLCYGSSLAVYPTTCRLCCPPPCSTSRWLERSLCTLFLSGPRQCRDSSQRFSRCLRPPPTPTDSTAHSGFRSHLQYYPAHDLGCSRVDRLAHLIITHLLESFSALALKKSQFKIQQEQERHVKYRCRETK